MAKLTLLLPQPLEAKLKTLAELQQETNGALLYVQQQEPSGLVARIDSLYVTGSGSDTHVIAEPVRLKILNRFFEENPDYRYVKWHTHCRGTGEYWFDKLSPGDIDSYREQLRENPAFIGMMISPTKKIVVARGSGQGDTVIRTVPAASDFLERERYVNERIQNAAAALGFSNLPSLTATHMTTR